MSRIRQLVNLYKAGKNLKRRLPGPRTLFVCTPATAYGGGQQYLYRLLEGIKPGGCNAIFAFPSFKDSDSFRIELSDRGADSLEFKKFKHDCIDFLPWLTILLSTSPKFIHVNGYNSYSSSIIYLSIILKNLMGFKLCITQHLSLFSDKGYSLITMFKKRRFCFISPNNYRWQMRDYYLKKIAFCIADGVIFVNKKHCELYSPLLGLKDDRTRSIINGVDTEKYNRGILKMSKRHQIRRDFNVKDDELLIIGVGNLIPQKRFDIFIMSISELIRSGNTVKAIIVGSGPLVSNLKSLCDSEGVSESVIFAGYRSQIEQLLNVADLFLMTSEDEGLPYALLEARACGLPAIATDVGGIKEVIRDQIDGFLVPFGDIGYIVASIKKALCDKDMRNNMGCEAREYTVKQFSVRKMQDETIETLKKYGLCNTS